MPNKWTAEGDAKAAIGRGELAEKDADAWSQAADAPRAGAKPRDVTAFGAIPIVRLNMPAVQPRFFSEGAAVALTLRRPAPVR